MIYNSLKHEEVEQSWELSCLVSAWEKEVESDTSSSEQDNIDNLYARAICLQTKEDYGFIMPSHMFYKWVKCGSLTDYDGLGYFLNWEGYKQEHVQCCISWLEDKIEKYPFVAWYNK